LLALALMALVRASLQSVIVALVIPEIPERSDSSAHRC
jgi:hypothetical protein